MATPHRRGKPVLEIIPCADCTNALDRAGELKRIVQPGATELQTTEFAATENELKVERSLVADLLPK